MPVEKTAFISYRRTNYWTARLIYEELRERDYNVFFDYESINAGDFSNAIYSQIAAKAHFVIVMTPSSIERCKEPHDWV